jgi:SAM-dependent methyltransferase
MAKKKTKAEELQDAVAEAVGAGRELHLESVDFSDPNRPKTCLEVDLPLLNINRIAGPEMSSGAARKPIYTWQKWWARRSSAVFRALLIAAAAKAPDDQGEAAKTIWDSFYRNHQGNNSFRNLKVADIFMGGGTTIVEGARLGMKMYGNDLNPVAWFVVRNEIAKIDPRTALKQLDAIEAEVKPQVMPYYACDCPRGHKGKWTHKPTGRVMGVEFDPLELRSEQRSDYEYDGPEVIYTFWVKHGPCQGSECDHRTPILQSIDIAIKALTVKAWLGKECSACGNNFDVEQKNARMAPGALFVVSHSEVPFAVMHSNGDYACPHCNRKYHDPRASSDGESSSLGKAKNKVVNLTLLVHPEWVAGSSGKDSQGFEYGGRVTDSPEATQRWNEERDKTLRFIEVRGVLPESITCPDTGVKVSLATAGTLPKRSTFACGNTTCGMVQDLLTSVKRSGTTAPMANVAIQGYCPECDAERQPYSGRFFDTPNLKILHAADVEWVKRRRDLDKYVPSSELPYGFMTHHLNGGIPNHGFTHWEKMFNSLQLLLHTQLLKAIDKGLPNVESLAALGVWQKYVQHDCMFCFWDSKQDCLAPHFSNNNYHPKQMPIQNNPFSKLGRGNWQSCVTTFKEAMDWREHPWDLVFGGDFPDLHIASKTLKLPVGDSPITDQVVLTCGSATNCSTFNTDSFDLVVTDPPFGDLLHYSELSDFYYVWLRLLLERFFPDLFSSEYTPKTLEAVSNRARQPVDADEFYQRLLTAAWKEANRILKPGGILVFTFHHSEDEPWVAVLGSLFNAGFYLEAAYPIRSDETKGEGEFGSRKIEFDIVHVCRKRLEEPEPISWARLRRQIMQDVRQLREIIEQHQKEGLGEADLQVIRRGKALEYYSRHYGKVYIEKGRESEFTVKDALLGINQLLEDESDTSSEAPPVTAEPYTRQFLRLFADKSTLDRDQMQKYLRGTGVSPSEFLERGWCSEEKKVFTITPPLEWATQWKGKARKAMSRDFDQSYFLIGACYDESGIKVSDTLESGGFAPHPAIPDLLDWFGMHGSDTDMKAAARRAKQIYSAWLAKNTKEVMVQHTLFDLENE